MTQRKGELEARIKSVCDRYVMGLLDEPNMLTPYRIVQHLAVEEESLPKPSVGAVSACLKRWNKIGFIEVGEKPFSFDCYTEAAEIEGLRSLKKKYRASLPKPPPKPNPVAMRDERVERVEPFEPFSTEVRDTVVLEGGVHIEVDSGRHHVA